MKTIKIKNRSNQKNKKINGTKESNRDIYKKLLNLKNITKNSNNNINENNLKIVENQNNKIEEKERDKDIRETEKIKKKFYSYEINPKEIQETLQMFLSSYNWKYKVIYYYESHYPYIWRLTIKCPRNSIYKNKQIDFKLDFNRGFNKITDNITIEHKIYHLNFGENGLLLFSIKYQEDKSFYKNLSELFDLIYDLFVEPNLKISAIFSKTKINLYKSDRGEYFRLAEKSVETMEKIPNI